MQHVGGVNVLETAEDLVDEGLEMGIGQGLAGTDNGSKIAFHELCNWHMSAQKTAASERDQTRLPATHLRIGMFH